MVRMDKLYVTPSEVRKRMFVEEDEYPDDYLLPIIEEAMGIVDKWTDTVWNGRVMETEEVHDVGKYVAGLIYGAGIRIPLRHYPVREIVELKVFFGTGYDDWTKKYPCEDPANGRGKCLWWLVPEDGYLFLQTFLLRWGGREVRIKYRYGRDDLDPRVKRFVLLYVERELLLREMTAVAVPEMSKGIGLSVEKRIKMLDQLIRDLQYQLATLKRPANNLCYKEVG